MISKLVRGGLLLALLSAAPVQAEVVYNPGASIAQLSGILDGPGLTVSNLAIPHGAEQQFGIFSGGKALLGVETGMFLSTGNVGSLQGPNNSAAYSHNTGAVYADPDIARFGSKAKYDPAIVEFDIVPQGDRLNFVFAFGSEEYPEYVCSRFNDAFGLFVSGPGLDGVQNAAFMPGSGDAIAVNNVNGGKAGSAADGATCNLGNANYFIDNGNGGGNPLTQLDGITHPITASLANLSAGHSYHVKLALADVGDPAYDSGAFFKWLTSTKSEPVDLSLQAGADKLTPAQGSEVKINYTISNASNTATSLVRVGLDWPAGLTWVGDNSAGTFNPATGEWDAGEIPANGSKTLTVRAQVGSAGNYVINGEILYAFNEDPDSTPFNAGSNPAEDDTASLTLSSAANLAPKINSNSGGGSAYVSVKEGQTAVTIVSATDPNGDAITYYINGGKDAARFSINPATGALSFITAPDYESPQDEGKDNLYEVEVGATDGSLVGLQALNVQVQDVTEGLAPKIISNGGGATASMNMPENRQAVTVVEAIDFDGDTVSYRLLAGEDEALFQINSNSGKLAFSQPPDYENPQDANRNNVYIVKVEATDGLNARSQTLFVTVTDVVENVAPQITYNNSEPSAVIKMEENQKVPLIVPAADADRDFITYSLDGGDDRHLFLISSAGVLSFIEAPDYENPQDMGKDNVYEVQVKVSDGSLFDNQILSIQVLDADEKPQNQAPTISNPGSVLYYENSDAIVDDFNAVDNEDSEDNGLVYSFDPQPDNALFSLDSVTGVLIFKNLPDYENPLDHNHDNAYITGVKVCDSDGACVARVLIVSVLDVDEDNDHDGLMDSAEKFIGTNLWNWDSDGDGLDDLNEVHDPTEPLDHDKDGLIDALDPDDDGDTILTKYEMPDPNGDHDPADARDIDHDGIPDYLDTDDDNDTILTRYEAPDANGDGIPADARDTDLDSMPDYLDADDDNDGSPTKDEQPDPNGDGNPDDAVDDDNNGYPSYLDISEDLTVGVEVRAFLNGAYDSTTGMMDDDLGRLGFIPDLQPYGELKTAFGYGNSSSTLSPFDYHGTETMSQAVKNATNGNAPVDWVLVELRDALDPTARRGVMAAILQRDGDIVDAVTGSKKLQLLNVADGRYYVVVRHRNHLGVMTATPLNLSTASTLIDFTSSATPVFGGNLARLQDGQTSIMWSGDTNNSNSVILNGPGSDSSVVLGSILVAPENTKVNANFQLRGYYATDLNMDGYVVFSGPANEINLLIGTVILFPDNSTGSANYIVLGSVPR